MTNTSHNFAKFNMSSSETTDHSLQSTNSNLLGSGKNESNGEISSYNTIKSELAVFIASCFIIFILLGVTGKLKLNWHFFF